MSGKRKSADWYEAFLEETYLWLEEQEQEERKRRICCLCGKEYVKEKGGYAKYCRDCRALGFCPTRH
jgi:hypothetical protein